MTLSLEQSFVRWLTLSIPQQSLYRGNLDQLMPAFPRVKKQVINGGRIMPAFKNILNDAQIQAVARYVATHAGK